MTVQPGDEIRVGSCVLELVAVEEVDVAVYPVDRFGHVLCSAAAGAVVLEA